MKNLKMIAKLIVMVILVAILPLIITSTFIHNIDSSSPGVKEALKAPILSS